MVQPQILHFTLLSPEQMLLSLLIMFRMAFIYYFEKLVSAIEMFIWVNIAKSNS